MSLPQPKKRDAEATRKKIMRAAAALFGSKGYEASTLRDIGYQADVNPALVAYYFQNKEGLFNAIIEDSVGFILSRLTNVLDETAAPPGRMEVYIQTLIELFWERPDFPAMILRRNVMGTLALPETKQDVKSLIQFFHMTKSILDDGYRAGVFQKVDPHIFHLQLVGAILYFVGTNTFREINSKDGGFSIPTKEAFIADMQAMALSRLEP